MGKALMVAAIFFLLALPCQAADKSISELVAIARAGGGIIVDMENRAYSVAELATLAANLKYQATLTIKMGRSKSLSVSQCAQIAKERPGQVIFWF